MSRFFLHLLLLLLPERVIKKQTGASKTVLRAELAKGRRDTGPKVGTEAPSFTLPLLSSDGGFSTASVQLTALQGRPVALVFGSYTCPMFRKHAPAIAKAHAALGDRVQFLFVYGREAHPSDGWAIPQQEKQGISYPTPTMLEHRAILADKTRKKFDLKMPIALDYVGEEVDAKYRASPVRLFVLDTEGVVIFKTKEGPFDVQIRAWKKCVADQAKSASKPPQEDNIEFAPRRLPAEGRQDDPLQPVGGIK